MERFLVGRVSVEQVRLGEFLLARAAPARAAGSLQSSRAGAVACSRSLRAILWVPSENGRLVRLQLAHLRVDEDHSKTGGRASKHSFTEEQKAKTGWGSIPSPKADENRSKTAVRALKHSKTGGRASLCASCKRLTSRIVSR